MPDTPRAGTPPVPPPRPLPSLATVQTTVEVLVGQIKGLRLDVERLGLLVGGLPQDVPRAPPAPVISYVTPTPVPPSTPTRRPSMAAKAALGTGRVGKVLVIATGALTVMGQLAALLEPKYVGPLEQAIRVLRALVGGDAP